MMRRHIWPLLAACAVLLTGCASGAESENAAAVQTAPAPESSPAAEGPAALDLGAPESAPEGVIWDDGVFLVEGAGTYRVTGSLAGKLAVDADGPVTLILEDVTLSGESCLDIRSHDPVTLSAAAGTVNRLTDTAPSASGEASSGEPASGGASEETGTDEEETAAEEENDASGAVITSKAPLLLSGEGSIDVTAGINNGIRCKDALTVESGVLNVVSANHGLKARGALTIRGGLVRVRSGGDGLVAETARLGEGVVALTGGQVELETDGRGLDADDRAEVSGGTLSVTSGKDAVRAGTVEVSGGALTLDAGSDGIQADTLLTISDGILSVVAGGGGGNASQHVGESFGPWSRQAAAEDSVSAKGLKSDGDIVVTGGRIALDTADDSIHCASLCTISGGEITILSSDDAIHSDDMLVIQGGSIDITDCFEGLEAYAVEIGGGDTVIRAVNDGINANGPEGGFGGWGGQTAAVDSVSGASVSYIRMTGGTVDLVVTGNTSNMGDGIDSNGAFYMEGGVLTVSTFGTFMENGIDTGSGGPVVTGGMVMAGGSATMQEGWSSASTQCCAMLYTGTQPAGTTVIITDEDGGVIWAVTLEDTFSCLLLSHPDMTVGHTYTVTYGTGSADLDFTSSNIFRSSGGGFGGFGGFGGRPGGR